MAIEVSHCGSGCTVGDLISEWVIYALALTIAGRTLFAEYLGDYVLAVAFGIVFQFFAIAPMRGLGVRDGLKAAAKADVISLTFFEIGLFGWMAVMAFVFFPAPNDLMPNSIAFWFLMQLGMIIGYFTSWPANVWLVRRGSRSRCDGPEPGIRARRGFPARPGPTRRRPPPAARGRAPRAWRTAAPRGS